MGYNKAYIQSCSKEMLLALVAKQPDIQWPSKFGPFLPPQLPKLAELRKALKGDYGYGPCLEEVSLRQPFPFRVIRQVYQAAAANLEQCPAAKSGLEVPPDFYPEIDRLRMTDGVQSMLDVVPPVDTATLHPVGDTWPPTEIAAEDPSFSPKSGPSRTANLDSSPMAGGLQTMLGVVSPVDTATLHPVGDAWPPTEIAAEDPSFSPKSGPSTANLDSLWMTDGLQTVLDVSPPVDTATPHPAGNTWPPTEVAAEDPSFSPKSGPSPDQLLMMDGLYTLPDFPDVDSASLRTFPPSGKNCRPSTNDHVDEAVATSSERWQQVFFPLSPNEQRVLDLQALQDFTNNDPPLAQKINHFRSMKKKNIPTVAHQIYLWEIAIGFVETTSGKVDWPVGDTRTIPISTIHMFLDRSSGWFSQVRLSVLLIRQHGPSSKNKVDKILEIYNGPPIKASLLQKKLADIGAELYGPGRSFKSSATSS